MSTRQQQRRNVCVVVLGDIGRSPRMQYHALSLAEHGHKVDLVGYLGEAPMVELQAQPLLSFHYLTENPFGKYLRRGGTAAYALKTVWQLINMLLVFVVMRRPHVVLVQNPPAIPALFACWLYATCCRARFVVDWHNYAHTIMALTAQPESLLVRCAKYIELFFGRRAGHNFCVTRDMKNDLENNYNIRATTLYDRPSEIFQPITLTEKHEFLMRIGTEYKELLGKDNSTKFTEKSESGVTLKSTRPGLLISSTSWTEDEDFAVLFGALQDYEDHHNRGNVRHLPKLVCVITGKGPMKSYYVAKMKAARWRHVDVITPWLEHSDYPKMLACADLGVSLHTSSSGLDLPMKVVDMFGCGLPVCAYYFKCLHELVKDGVNGYTFKTSIELGKLLHDWFERFPQNPQQIDTEAKFKSELDKFQALRWRENWNIVAAPVFK